jgi:hypothetical protein
MAKPVAERVRASRIRKKAVEGIPLSDDEAASLDEYETSKPPARGKSASSRVVHLDIEEQSAAEGDHPHPDAWAAVARSEGLRADTLLQIVTNRLIQCNDQYLRLLTYSMERSERLENAHVGLIEAMREHFLARIDAEGQAKVAQQIAASAGDSEDGELGKLMEMLAPVIAAKLAADSKNPPAKVKRKKEKPLGSVD